MDRPPPSLCPEFAVERISITSETALRVCSAGSILLVLHGEKLLLRDDTSELTLTAGSTVFIGSGEKVIAKCACDCATGCVAFRAFCNVF